MEQYSVEMNVEEEQIKLEEMSPESSIPEHNHSSDSSFAIKRYTSNPQGKYQVHTKEFRNQTIQMVLLAVNLGSTTWNERSKL